MNKSLPYLKLIQKLHSSIDRQPGDRPGGMRYYNSDSDVAPQCKQLPASLQLHIILYHTPINIWYSQAVIPLLKGLHHIQGKVSQQLVYEILAKLQIWSTLDCTNGEIPATSNCPSMKEWVGWWVIIILLCQLYAVASQLSLPHPGHLSLLCIIIR